MQGKDTKDILMTCAQARITEVLCTVAGTVLDECGPPLFSMMYLVVGLRVRSRMPFDSDDRHRRQIDFRRTILRQLSWIIYLETPESAVIIAVALSEARNMAMNEELGRLG
jgi:hypothetical protein